MAGPLLATKLHVPRRRRGLVARRRLRERLERGNEAALTLVSAPAGFGKTTVLTEWLTDAPADGRAVAWLSLDARDNDPALFWAYLVAALQTVAPDVGTGTLSLLQSPSSSAESALATLLNDLAGVPGEIVLVLDDYHVIGTPAVHEGIAFLIEHLPAQVHLVIAGRADPPLPLARLRSRGDLVEVRAADLRFTAEEAAQYLTEAMGLALTPADVAVLDERTEGWIAALQLAALSLQGRDDVSDFITGFAGDDRYIVDYLVEEVLERQPERIRSFLLQTSILTRLSGPLCDGVTGRTDAKDTLEALDRGNLFLVALDDRRRWYRYHHLFADVLQAHLLAEQPDAVAGLHQRASDWHVRNGERAEAIGHALAGGDAARAADLIEPALPELQRGRQEATMQRWLEALPEELIRQRPVLAVGYAGCLMLRGDVAGVEAQLRDAERWLTGTGNATEPASDPMIVIDEEAFGRLPSMIATYRAGQAHLSGDVPATKTYARRALDLAPPDDPYARAAPAGLLGLAYWRTGDLDNGYHWYAECAASLEKAGFRSDVTGCAIALADIRLTQARLGEAIGIYEHALRLVSPQTGPALRGAADMHVGLAGALTERGELDAAGRHLASSAELGEHMGLPQNPYRWRVAMARLREAEGDVDGALALLDEAERRYAADYFPEVRRVPALRARLQARHGQWADALAWAERSGLSADHDLDYLREFEQLTLARALVARFAADSDDRAIGAALRLLPRVLSAAEEGGRTGTVLDGLVVLALAESARGEQAAALTALRRALALAEPHRYVRIFLDEGRPITDLLAAIPPTGPGGAYARRLLAAPGSAAHGLPREDGGPTSGVLMEPLSARELDVLRLLGTDLDGPDIARQLFVSLNTVRTHTKNIYAKLGVTNRRAAVRRAEELDLTGRHRTTHGAGAGPR